MLHLRGLVGALILQWCAERLAARRIRKTIRNKMLKLGVVVGALILEWCTERQRSLTLKRLY